MVKKLFKFLRIEYLKSKAKYNINFAAKPMTLVEWKSKIFSPVKDTI